MTERLSVDELVKLVERVFQPRSHDCALAILVDLPRRSEDDTPAWQARRQMAAEWAQGLAAARERLELDCHLVLYRAVASNNAELPPTAWLHQERSLPPTAEHLEPDAARPFEAILSEHSLLLAPTQLSATAPLKLAAPRLGFRAATMPGFSPAMIPALRIDYQQVNQRVTLLAGLLDEATSASLEFLASGGDRYRLELDLRWRRAHASGGLFPEPGQAGNLPSGESYIVPYEGEREPSRSSGQLPVQLGREIVVFRIANNRAVEVTSPGPVAAEQAELLRREPARGNLAELGLGVLGDFGLQPCGEVLLDEKLGLHIAFGRSDHFGGRVGPPQFSSPDQVIHQDHVYVPALQPDLEVASAVLRFPEREPLLLMKDGQYQIDFSSPGAP